ncbi:spoIIIJ-associated protein [Melghirimyces thermohalophilus]|uniref:RNA-binding protein KhpB n=1 Tax=Melghirimyces thermohalophilus TaxID=1236220 RepID=A0A1G6QTT1_9BACL|nr:RNA-binding cell elongation regulator Jag/EloR [Melghirimyces thermohalophilus]SDC95748.1 spoIIIJ-associated protein [Melghirimyces thermohalophilus]
MKKVTVTAKTVDSAVAEALRQLGADRERAKISVLEEPSRRFLGLFGGRDAKVEVELISSPSEEALRFLREVLDHMGLDGVEMEKSEESDHVRIQFTGEDLGLLIGRRGQTLDALQYLTNVAANRATGPYTRLILDAEGYRERRRQSLIELADRIARKVKRTKQAISLEPMSPMERKVIHNHIQKQYTDLTTQSEGEEPRRNVVVAPRDKR